MDRQQKEAVVSDFRDNFLKSNAAFLVGYKGLNVSQIQSLRKDLRSGGGCFKIAKARLMKIATKEIDGINGFRDNLKDQIGLVFASDEVPTIAKKLVEFAKSNEDLRIISAFFESKVLTKEQVDNLAALPSKDVLLSMIMNLLQAPASGVARITHQIIARLLYMIKQVPLKKES